MRCLPFLLLCAAIPAQTNFTSPRGLNAIEGNNAFAHWAGARRFQQVDYTQAGTPFVIQSISWRRNGGSSGAAGTRTMDLTVDLGRTDFGALHLYLDDNFLPGTRSTVFNQNGVVFPDWSASIPGPTPFDFKVMLATPFVYTGRDALVIDFSFQNTSSNSLLSVDRDFNGPTSPPAGALLGTGCVATGRTAAFAHTSGFFNFDILPTPLYGMRYRLGGTNAPAAGQVVALIDGANANLPGIFCTTLFALPTWSFPMRSLSAGLVPDVSFGFTNIPSAVGAVLYSQLAVLDPGQTPLPITLSNGRATTIPSVQSSTSHRCSYGWYTIPSGTNTALSAHFTGGGMVMLLQ